MLDQSGQVATGRDTLYSLTIDAAAALYARAGHPRTPRSIQRYCASGHLDSIKEATMLGDKYFIDADSVARHIAQIEELISLDTRATGRDMSRPVASLASEQATRDGVRQDGTTGDVVSPPVASAQYEFHSAIVRDDTALQTATPATSASRPVATGESDTPRYVEQLERDVERADDDREFLRDQIKTKDVQIAALLERDRETNILVGSLQRMLAPLLGQPRAHSKDHDQQPPL